MAVKFRFHHKDFDTISRSLGAKGAKKLESDVINDLENGIHSMAKDSFEYAPVETGDLKMSILNSVKRDGKMEYIYGSHLPYAQRQEYEHKTKNAYFRRSIALNAPDIKRNIEKSIERL